MPAQGWGGRTDFRSNRGRKGSSQGSTPAALGSLERTCEARALRLIFSCPRHLSAGETAPHAHVSPLAVSAELPPAEETEQDQEHTCETLLMCIVTVLSHGLRSGGGVGDVLRKPSKEVAVSPGRAAEGWVGGWRAGSPRGLLPSPFIALVPCMGPALQPHLSGPLQGWVWPLGHLSTAP